MSADVLVIGGGAVAMACARELAAAGERVTVLEADPAPAGEAWRAAAGMLAAQIEAEAGDPVLDLALAGRERYAELAGPLLAATGIDIGLWRQGIARLAAGDDDAQRLRARVAWQRQQGYACDWLDAGEVAERWPWAGPSAGALWAPQDAALDPLALVTALRRDAEQRGAVFRADTIRALEWRGARVTAALGRERHEGRRVVLAAGAWSGGLAGLPRPLSVAPVRGQMAAFAWPADTAPTVLYRHDCYVVHRGGEAVVGSTMEYAGFASEVTSDGLARVLGAAWSLARALRDAPVRRSWAGLRPMTPDGRPIVGREPRAENLLYATGHGRNGILLAGITGVLVRQLLHGEPLPDEARALAPERFWRW